MQTKQLQQVLLTYYLFAIEVLKELDTTNEQEILDEALNLNVSHGLCSCAHHGFSEEIGNSEWVNKYTLLNSCYWGMTIYNAFDLTKETAIECLMIRVRILQEILKEA